MSHPSSTAPHPLHKHYINPVFHSLTFPQITPYPPHTRRFFVDFSPCTHLLQLFLFLSQTVKKCPPERQHPLPLPQEAKRNLCLCEIVRVLLVVGARQAVSIIVSSLYYLHFRFPYRYDNDICASMTACSLSPVIVLFLT